MKIVLEVSLKSDVVTSTNVNTSYNNLARNNYKYRMCVSSFDVLRRRVYSTVQYTTGVIILFSIIGGVLSAVSQRHWVDYLRDNFGWKDSERDYEDFGVASYSGDDVFSQVLSGLTFTLVGIACNLIIPYCGYRAQKTGSCACCYCSCTLLSFLA